MIADQSALSLVRLPKEKLPTRESNKARAAYEAYLAMGIDRSLPKLHEWYRERSKNAPGPGGRKMDVPSVTQLKRWSRAFHWQRRVMEAEAAEVERQKRAQQEAIDKMNQEHALIGRQVLFSSVEQYLSKLKTGDVQPYVLVQGMKVGSKLERLARGEATQKVAADIQVQGNMVQLGTTGINIRDLTDEELEQLHQLALAFKAREEQETERLVEGSIEKPR